MRFPYLTHRASTKKKASIPAGIDLPSLRLHTSHLTSAQRSYLAQYPTYTSRLTALEALATQVQLLKDTIHSRELGKLPNIASTVLSRGEREAFEGPREECRQLETRLLEWDDELAGLAEALLARPRFGVGESVVWFDREEDASGAGGWWWRVPDGNMTLPRHSQSADVPVERYGLSNFPTPKLTRRITKLFRRSPSPGSRLQRRHPTGTRLVE